MAVERRVKPSAKLKAELYQKRLRTPQASWGNLMNGALELATLTGRPWAWVPPGLCIVGTVLALLLVGEGLRKGLNPRRA